MTRQTWQVCFETGQLRKKQPLQFQGLKFKTLSKFNFSKQGVFETGPCSMAGSCYETGVAVRALTENDPLKERLERHINPWFMALQCPSAYSQSRACHADQCLWLPCHLPFPLLSRSLSQPQKARRAALSTRPAIMAYNRESSWFPEGKSLECLCRYVQEIR